MKTTTHRRLPFGAGILLSGMVVASGAIAAPAHADDLPPSISDFAISPGTVDVTSASRTVTLSVHLSDPSGIGYIWGSSLTTTVGLPSIPVGTWTEVDATDPTDGVWQATATVPQAMPASVWTAHINELRDGVGNLSFTDHASSPLTVTDSAPDATAPVVSDLAATPNPVDVSTGAKQVNISVHLADPAGVTSPGTVALTSDSGRQYGLGILSRSAGTIYDGVWETTATVPAGVSPGTWSLAYTGASDAFGNVVLNTTSSQFRVANANPDTAPPVVDRFDVDKTSVDVTNEDADVNITAHVTDATGVASVSVDLPDNPLGIGELPLSRASGTATDGIYQFTIPVPRGMRAGTYAATLNVSDTLGNTDADAGEATLTIINSSTGSHPGGDTTPPVIDDFAATPIDVSGGPATTTVSMHVTDASGVSEITAYLRTPDGASFGAIRLTRAAGTATDGTWTGTASIPAGAPDGTWTAQVNEVWDNAGNWDYMPHDADFVVTDTHADVSPPAATIESVSPVDVSDGAQDATVRVHLEDPSGIGDGDLTLNTVVWAGSNTSAQTLTGYGLSRISGTDTDGIWQSTVSIPRGSAAGSWTLYVRNVADVWGNTLLASAPAVLSVVDQTPDTAPPAISDLAITPTAVDVSTGLATVTVTARLSDASGKPNYSLDIGADADGSWPTFIDSTLTRINGTPSAWTLTAVAAIPVDATSGRWTVTVGDLTDPLGNVDRTPHTVTFTVGRGAVPPSPAGSGGGTGGTGAGTGGGTASNDPAPSPTGTPSPVRSPSVDPTPTPSPTSPTTLPAVVDPPVTKPLKLPGMQGHVAVGKTVTARVPRVAGAPANAHTSIVWYVHGKKVGTGRRLELKARWAGETLQVRVITTWGKGDHQHRVFRSSRSKEIKRRS